MPPDLSKLSNEELMRLHRTSASADLSKVPTEQLMKMRAQPRFSESLAAAAPENISAGAGKAVYDVGRGAGQATREVLPSKVSDLVGLPTQADIDEAASRDAPLMATKGGTLGHLAGNVAMFAPTAMIPGANTVTGAATVGGLMGLAQPVTSAEAAQYSNPRARNVVIGAATAGGVQAVAKPVAGYFANKAANATTESAALEAQNATRDAALKAGRDAGYVVSPSAVNPNVANQAVESVGGKIATEQTASSVNQKVTDTLARDALVLPRTAGLSDTTLDLIRKQAGRAYEAVKSRPGRMAADPEFDQAVSAIGADFSQAAKDFPASTKNTAIEALTSDLAPGNWTPRGIIEKVKQLRFEASSNFKAFDDPAKLALARAQRQAAEALDGLVERNLTASGDKALSDAYQAARVTIAKAHDISAALGADGHVNAQVLAKIGDSKTLSGELGTIADFAGSFPKAVQPPSKIGSPAVTALRTSLGAATGTVLGGPVGTAVGGAAAYAAPWTVRQMMLSGPGQSLMATPSYGSGVGSRTIAQMLDSRALPELGSAGALEYARRR